jgi:hypothetical protein
MIFFIVFHHYTKVLLLIFSFPCKNGRLHIHCHSISWNRGILEKLLIAQLVNFPPFMKPESSLLWSQESYTGWNLS